MEENTEIHMLYTDIVASRRGGGCITVASFHADPREVVKLLEKHFKNMNGCNESERDKLRLVYLSQLIAKGLSTEDEQFEYKCLLKEIKESGKKAN